MLLTSCINCNFVLLEGGGCKYMIIAKYAQLAYPPYINDYPIRNKYIC